MRAPWPPVRPVRHPWPARAAATMWAPAWSSTSPRSSRTTAARCSGCLAATSPPSSPARQVQPQAHCADLPSGHPTCPSACATPHTASSGPSPNPPAPNSAPAARWSHSTGAHTAGPRRLLRLAAEQDLEHIAGIIRELAVNHAPSCHVSSTAGERATAAGGRGRWPWAGPGGPGLKAMGEGDTNGRSQVPIRDDRWRSCRDCAGGHRRR